MGPGYCVIGLEPSGANSFRSVRPLPPQNYAWRDPFPFKRGDCVRCELTEIPTRPPHFEDRQSSGLRATGASLGENDLVRSLKMSGVSTKLEGLFGCEVDSGGSKGNYWIDPSQGQRSICGCEFRNIRFRVFQDPGRLTLRAEIALPSDESLRSVPVVDRSWNRFLQEVAARLGTVNVGSRSATFLNGGIRNTLLDSPNCFARIGLARADNNKCWLMLDSLFPQPTAAWLESIRH
jgi:hypothetical protein